MLEWHAALDKLSRDTKTAVEPRTKSESDPIAAAVANVGYSRPETETASVAPTTTTTGAATVEEDDEVSGGSSAEEEDEEHRQARTAPSTPAPNGTLASPLDAEGEKQAATSTAEVLPTYGGNPEGVPVSFSTLSAFRSCRVPV